MNWFSPGTHPSLVPRPWECFRRTAITVTPVPSALYPSRAHEACNQITTFGPIIIFRPPAKTSSHWHHCGHCPCHVIWHVLVFISCGLLRFLNTMAQSFLAPQVLHFLVVFCQTPGPLTTQGYTPKASALDAPEKTGTQTKTWHMCTKRSKDI